MDIAGLSVHMIQSDALQQVGIAVLDKQISTAENMGSMIAESISAMPSPSLEALANPAVGNSIDILV